MNWIIKLPKLPKLQLFLLKPYCIDVIIHKHHIQSEFIALSS